MSNEIIKLDITLRNALEYYDTNQLEINNFLNKVKYIKFVNNKKSNDQIIFYDDNSNILLESSYEIMGIYMPQNKIWKWSWSIPTIINKYTYISRKILEYALNLDPIKDYVLKTQLINSKIKIINDIQIDIHTAISSYLSKKPFIFKFYNKYDKQDDLLEYNYNDEDNDKYMILFLFILDYK